MIRISGVIRESIVDGPGIRFVVFTQGCPHNCLGCHNPQTHDLKGGYLIKTQKILEEFLKNPLLQGMTLSGGEPILQSQNLLWLAKEVKNAKKDLVIYSGYTYEELMEMSEKTPSIKELLSLCDILIDGKFILAERDLTLTFRGSKNQKVIDLNAT